MQVNVYTVSQINGYIRRLIDNDVFLSQLYIEGEISNLILHPSGHIYFSLKDSTGAINCVMFRSYAEKLAFMPENGGAVLAGGRVSLYEKTGKYQFYVDYMQPAGKGKLYLAFEELKKRLEAEGLFDSSKKKPIPQFPKTIAVVTSPSGAAVRDIINVAGRRDPSVRLVIMPVLVQGENAAEDIARGIALVNEWGGADTIIVGRGGGSMEDLWAFNEETVARAVMAARAETAVKVATRAVTREETKAVIPVISAVGHEIDFTIADFVSDFRAPTPSAAAELAVPAAEPVQRRFRTAVRQMDTAFAAKYRGLKMRLVHTAAVRGMKRPLEKTENYQIYTAQLLDKLDRLAVQNADKYGARLEKAMACRT